MGRPRRSAIRRAEHAHAEPRPPVALAGAAVHGRGPRRIEGECAHRRGPLVVGARGPRGASVEGLPNASVRRPCEHVRWISGVDRERGHASRDVDARRTVRLAVDHSPRSARSPLWAERSGRPHHVGRFEKCLGDLLGCAGAVVSFAGLAPTRRRPRLRALPAAGGRRRDAHLSGNLHDCADVVLGHGELHGLRGELRETVALELLDQSQQCTPAKRARLGFSFLQHRPRRDRGLVSWPSHRQPPSVATP